MGSRDKGADPITGDRGNHAAEAADSAPVAVVERFLDRMRALDSDGAAVLLAADVRYEKHRASDPAWPRARPDVLSGGDSFRGGGRGLIRTPE